MTTGNLIAVKFLQRGQRQTGMDHYLRQFPGRNPIWGSCHFLFDPDIRAYDWLVVCDDLPRAGDLRSESSETLACPRAHTMLLTTEPSSIKLYSRRFAAQFEHVWTSQEPDALQHPRITAGQPMLHWFYGLGGKTMLDFDHIVAHAPVDKTGTISTVCSAKQQRHTLHHRRYQFTQKLKSLVPELEIFGRGVRDMADKAEALDAYRYHVAVENHHYPHHWTEKLADPFLGCCLPFYYGAPNAGDYFPPGSFIPIDIFDVEGAARIIRSAILNGEYEKRLPFILEARRRALFEHNSFAALSRFITQHHSNDESRPGRGTVVLSRRKVRTASLSNCLDEIWEKLQRRLRRPKGPPMRQSTQTNSR